MRDINSTFVHHFYQITRAEIISDVPTDTENNDDTLKVTAAEESR
jgi:hypothetical protein